jgi:hypothetical protein
LWHQVTRSRLETLSQLPIRDHRQAIGVREIRAGESRNRDPQIRAE